MRFKELSQEQISLLADTGNTGKELVNLLGVGIATISRWRKKLGIKTPIGKKPGKPTPSRRTGEMVECHNPECSKEVWRTKTRLKRTKTHYCSTECMGSCPDRRKMISEIDKSYMNTEAYRSKKRKDTTPAFRQYRNRVKTLTEKTYEAHKHIINPSNLPRTISGVEGGYQLDHIIEVKYGFQNNIPPEELSVVENLRMLPWRENLARNKHLSS
jgi:hypothetical protein